MNKFKVRFISTILLLPLLFLLTGCQETIKKTENSKEWKMKTSQIFYNAKFEEGGYIPIDLLNKDSMDTSLDQTWRSIEMLKMVQQIPQKKKEIISTINTYLKEESLDIRDISKIIAILEEIEPNNSLIDILRSWIKTNYDSSGWFSNKIYNNSQKQDIDNYENKISDQIEKLDILYFVTLYNKQVLTENQIKKIKENIISLWDNMEGTNDEKFTLRYLILENLVNLEFDISKLNEIHNYKRDLTNRFKKLQSNPYGDILMTGIIVEFLESLDPQFILGESFIKKIIEKQYEGFPLNENLYSTSGLGSYIVVKMLNPKYIDKIDKQKLVNYLNNNQSESTGFFYNDKTFKPNLLATSISVLILNNLGEEYSDLEKDFIYLNTEFEKRMYTKELLLNELYYILRALKDTEYFVSNKNILKDYVLNTQFQLQNVQDIYYYINVLEYLELNLPKETKKQVINVSEASLSKLIAIKSAPDFEQIVYSVEILQKCGQIIDSKTKNEVLKVVHSRINKEENTIIEQFYIYECLELLNEQIPATLKSNIRKYLNHEGGIKLNQNKEVVTLQSIFYGIELLKRVYN